MVIEMVTNVSIHESKIGSISKVKCHQLCQLIKESLFKALSYPTIDQNLIQSHIFLVSDLLINSSSSISILFESLKEIIPSLLYQVNEKVL